MEPSEDELMELFGQFGDISQIHLVVDKDTKQSKGIAYVLYTLPESAVRYFLILLFYSSPV